MATENRILDISYEAAEDLSSYQYHYVVLNSSALVRLPDSNIEIAEGILQNAPESGQAAVVRTHGISKVVSNAALTIGTYVKPEYVGAADAGKADDAAGELQCVRGIILEPASAEDDLASVKIIDPSPQKIIFTISLSAFTANTTVRNAVAAIGRAMKITRITVSAATIPADADGTCLLAVLNYDASATAEDALLAASFNLETLATAKASENMTLTATPADLILAAGDTIYADLISNSAAIDTNMAVGTLTIEADIL